MIHAEAAFFDNAPVQHVAAYWEHQKRMRSDPFYALWHRRARHFADEARELAAIRRELEGA